METSLSGDDEDAASYPRLPRMNVIGSVELRLSCWHCSKERTWRAFC